MDYWFVRARHVETGREVQRIAAPSRNGDGLTAAAVAADDMKAFLVSTGIATDGAHAWEIVEAHRFLASSPMTISVRSHRAASADPLRP